MAAFALGGVTISSWGPRLAAMRGDLGVGDAGLGLILAGVTVGAIAGLVISSPFLAALGARRGAALLFGVIAVGLLLIGIGPGIAQSVPVTIGGFVLIGLGIGTVDVLLNVEGAAVELSAGRTLMPLLHGAWSAGAIVGAGIGAACAALDVDYAWQFSGEAVLVAVVGILAASALRAQLPPPEEKAPVARRVRDWLRGWTDVRLLLIGVVMLGVELGEGTASNWLTLAAHDGHAQPDAIAALFLVVFAAAELAARIVGGPVVDRIGRVAAVRITIALGIVGTVLFILADSLPLIVLGTILWGIGVSMGFPLGMSAAAASGPNPAARVSVVASIGYLANLGGPPLVGALSQSFGLLQALWAVVISLALGLLVAGSLRSRRVPAEDSIPVS